MAGQWALLLEKTLDSFQVAERCWVLIVAEGCPQVVRTKQDLQTEAVQLV